MSASDPNSIFDDLNEELWDGELPRALVALAKTRKEIEGQFVPGLALILIDRNLADDEERLIRVLLHEMCHYAAVLRHGVKPRTPHGREWQEEMLRLADMGERWAEEEAEGYRRGLPTRQNPCGA